MRVGFEQEEKAGGGDGTAADEEDWAGLDAEGEHEGCAGYDGG